MGWKTKHLTQSSSYSSSFCGGGRESNLRAGIHASDQEALGFLSIYWPSNSKYVPGIYLGNVSAHSQINFWSSETDLNRGIHAKFSRFYKCSKLFRGYIW